MKGKFSILNSGSLKGQLLRGGLMGIVVRVMSVLATVVSSVVLARLLGPDQYGLYAYVFALISLLAFPVQMGLPILVVRETAKAETLRDWALMRGIWTWATGLIVIGSIIMIGLILLWLFLFGDWMSAARRAAFMWALPLIPLIALGQARAAAMRGLRYVFLGQFPNEVLRPVLLAAFVAGAAILSTGLTAKLALTSHAIVATLTFTLGVVLLLRARPAEMRQQATRQMDHRAWFRAILPLSLISGLQVTNQNTDLLILGFFRTDIEVGIYRVALSGASLAMFGLTAVSLGVQPYVARLFAQGDTARLQKLASLGALAALGVTLPVVSLFVFAGKPILSLVFGPEFKPAYQAMVILSVAQGVNAFFGLVGSFLIMSGNEWETTKGLIVAAVANVVLNVLLIPSFGVEGAATATGTSIILWNILFWRASRKLLGIDCTPIALLSRRHRD